MYTQDLQIPQTLNLIYGIILHYVGLCSGCKFGYRIQEGAGGGQGVVRCVCRKHTVSAVSFLCFFKYLRTYNCGSIGLSGIHNGIVISERKKGVTKQPECHEHLILLG